MKITLPLVPQNQHLTKIFFQNAKNCQCKMTADIIKEDVVISRNDQDLKLGFYSNYLYRSIKVIGSFGFI